MNDFIRRLPLLLLMMFLPVACALAGDASYTTNSTVELVGTFGIATGLDANDKKERYYYLKLDRPIAVTDNDFGQNETNVMKIQLAPHFDQSLRKFKGKRVVVKGSLFHSHTAHHHTRILMEVIKAEDFRLADTK